MSETQEDQNPEQLTEAEALRRNVELETGALLPRWLTVTLYAVFVPFCLFSAFWIGRSIIIQESINDYLQVLAGPWEDEPPPMDSKVVTACFSYCSG